MASDTKSAIEQILSDEHEVIADKSQGQPMFDFETDYSDILRKHEAAIENWKILEDDQKKEYKKGLIDLSLIHI